MSFSSYSLTPSANTTIGGVSIAENCPAANINNAIRQLAADGKELSDTVVAIPSAMPVSGGAFTGNITRSGRGAYRHNNDPTLIDGRDIWLLEGTALPTPAEGMEVTFYA